VYCSTCACDYDGWTGKCPNCKNILQEGKPPTGIQDQSITYENLSKIIEDHDGKIEIDLSATKVGRSKSTRFPYIGYGYAWTKRMQGSRDGINVDLSTTRVGKDRKRTFPYQGFGYAWQQELQGRIAGNEAKLTARKVSRMKRWSFPYKGFGYAWTDELDGECGQDISVTLNITQVGKNRRWRFPYFGFGYAWAKEGILSLTLKNNNI
jgi:hypothetical protein